MAFLYTNNELSEREARKNSIYDSNKKNKGPSINLTKEVKDLYSKNYRTLKKQIKEDTNKWDTNTWIGRINIIKMSMLSKPMYRFNPILIKMPMAYFTDLEHILQKFIWNQKDYE